MYEQKWSWYGAYALSNCCQLLAHTYTRTCARADLLACIHIPLSAHLGDDGGEQPPLRVQQRTDLHAEHEARRGKARVRATLDEARDGSYIGMGK